VAKIIEVKAREIFDSRGNPTIACTVFLDNNIKTTGFVPSGAASGPDEALELRDNDPKRFEGKGVLRAVNIVNTEIRNAIVNSDVSSAEEIDQKMLALDGTANKTKLGGNSILSVSLAIAKAAAQAENVPLYHYLAQRMGKTLDQIVMPIPFLNILNGGKHAIGSTDFQEFMVVPTKFGSFKNAISAGTEIFHALGKILTERNYQPLVGDEGGYAPSLFSNEQAMELLMMAIAEANYSPGEDIFIALDPAASRIFEDDFYVLHRENRNLTSVQLVDFYDKWCEKFPIISIEDPFDHNDWTGWQNITQRVGERIEIIGDDIYSTNQALLQKGIENRASTGILIKPNQVGTVTEVINTIKAAGQAGFKVVISHRSGETEDTFIADLAIASGCGAIKAGAPCRSERTAKYNRLIEIEEENTGHTQLAQWG